MFLVRRTWHAVVPRPLRALMFNLRNHIRILEIETGHFRSASIDACVDRQGNPLPWYTYPTIEYLKQLDFSGKDIFEYGAGNSTLFWAGVGRSVLSIEDNPGWYEKVKHGIEGRPNCEIKLITDKTAYIQEISRHSGFDVIVVDGSYRLECAGQAVANLRPGGMIILDNADRFIKSSQYFRDAGLIEVDMIGFGPLVAVTWCTSLFLHRQFNFPPRGTVQPEPGTGSVHQIDE